MHRFDILESGVKPEDATNALILLHGRGATAENIMPLGDYFSDGSWYMVAPQATGYQWYPYSFLVPQQQNEPWLTSAVEYVGKLIKNISAHIPHEHIYLMGFSQGACLSAEVAARNARRYGGLAIFTGGLIGDEPGWDLYKGDFNGTPVYISNGDNDPHIPVERSELTRRHMEQTGAVVKLDIFPGRDHTISIEEIENARSHIFRLDA